MMDEPISKSAVDALPRHDWDWDGMGEMPDGGYAAVADVVALHDALAAENARLIHDIERAQVALSEMATDNEKLRKLLQEVLAVAERNERGVVTDAARAAITAAP